MFCLFSMEGPLVDNRDYLSLYLGGTPSPRTGTSQPSCLLLDNRLYIWVFKFRAILVSRFSRITSFMKGSMLKFFLKYKISKLSEKEISKYFELLSLKQFQMSQTCQTIQNSFSIYRSLIRSRVNLGLDIPNK